MDDSNNKIMYHIYQENKILKSTVDELTAKLESQSEPVKSKETAGNVTNIIGNAPGNFDIWDDTIKYFTGKFTVIFMIIPLV